MLESLLFLANPLSGREPPLWRSGALVSAANCAPPKLAALTRAALRGRPVYRKRSTTGALGHALVR